MKSSNYFPEDITRHLLGCIRPDSLVSQLELLKLPEHEVDRIYKLYRPVYKEISDTLRFYNHYKI